MTAPPEGVWAVLADGWLYGAWVVGAAHIRQVETAWPGVGSRIHHKAGPWPLSIQDSTSVLVSEPASELVLQARGWPLGEARVRLVLEPDGAGGCVVTMEETLVSGPAARLHNPATAALLRARNTESLARLGDLVEGHAR